MKKKDIIELISNYKPKYLYRRKDGYIDKFEVINENTVLHLQTGVATNLDEIILLGKISESIIDLIECGDYVNGQKITKITGDPFVKGQIDLWTDRTIPFGKDYEQERFIESEIESIVTKEQFGSMKYIIGGE